MLFGSRDSHKEHLEEQAGQGCPSGINFGPDYKVIMNSKYYTRSFTTLERVTLDDMITNKILCLDVPEVRRATFFQQIVRPWRKELYEYKTAVRELFQESRGSMLSEGHICEHVQ